MPAPLLMGITFPRPGETGEQDRIRRKYEQENWRSEGSGSRDNFRERCVVQYSQKVYEIQWRSV